MKKLMLLLVMMICALGCSAESSEGLGVSQEAICTGPAVCTGSVGSAIKIKGADYFVMAPYPGEAYSAQVSTPNGSGKISWGAASGFVFRTSGCSNAPCVAWPSGSITSLKLHNASVNVSPYVEFIVNGVKAAELTGATNASSLQNTQPFSGSLRRVHQDTGANSRFYFEGYDAGVWKSWAGFFVADPCGAIP